MKKVHDCNKNRIDWYLMNLANNLSRHHTPDEAEHCRPETVMLFGFSVQEDDSPTGQ